MNKLEAKIVIVSDVEEVALLINREKKLFNATTFVKPKNGCLPVITGTDGVCKVLEDKGFKRVSREEIVGMKELGEDY